VGSIRSAAVSAAPSPATRIPPEQVYLPAKASRSSISSANFQYGLRLVGISDASKDNPSVAVENSTDLSPVEFPKALRIGQRIVIHVSQCRNQIREFALDRPFPELDLHMSEGNGGRPSKVISRYAYCRQASHGIPQRRNISADGIDLGLPARAVRRLIWGNLGQRFIEVLDVPESHRPLKLG
jgi:hypothetical protein